VTPSETEPVECDECAALVAPGRMSKHMGWHADLRDELLRLLHGDDR
jgi:hypothetical protein